MTTSVAEQAQAGTLSAAWPRVQAALRVGAVDDPLEREADRIAECVLPMPDPAPALAGGCVGDGPTDEVRRCPGGCPPEGCDEHDLLQRRPAGRPGAGEVPAGDAAPLSTATAAAIRG